MPNEAIWADLDRGSFNTSVADAIIFLSQRASKVILLLLKLSSHRCLFSLKSSGAYRLARN